MHTLSNRVCDDIVRIVLVADVTVGLNNNDLIHRMHTPTKKKSRNIEKIRRKKFRPGYSAKIFKYINDYCVYTQFNSGNYIKLR